jgi:predicted metallopeptidase
MRQMELLLSKVLITAGNPMKVLCLISIKIDQLNLNKHIKLTQHQILHQRFKLAAK